MLQGVQSAFKIPELKRKILYTLGLLVVCRLGAHIPTPGIDRTVLSAFFREAQGTLFGLYDMFVGGAFENATIFAMGIMPNISASIILQLLGSMIPYFQRLQKEGEEGRRKINQYTRYGTVLLSAIQALGVAADIESINFEGRPAVLYGGIGFKMLTALTMTAGTVLLMWIGEQITERGIGNGISLIITVGILAGFVPALKNELIQLRHGTQEPLRELFLLVIMVGIVAAVVLITQGQRRIPVQYAKRIVGRKIYGGTSTHLPLRVNTPGVIPIIFAQSIIFAPRTLTAFMPNNPISQAIDTWFRPGGLAYNVLYSVLIIFFAYFYTAIVFNPVDVADNVRKFGGFIPGIRPGKRTSEYIDRILTRITLPGGIFLAAIAIVPFFLMQSMKVAFFFGGTGVLIVVGVALDTLQQVEAHLMMRHYDGFLKKGRLRGRLG